MKSRNKIIMYSLILILAIVAIIAYYDGRSDRENVPESLENQE